MSGFKAHMTYEQKMALSMDETWKRSVAQIEGHIADTYARLDLPTDKRHREDLIASIVYNTGRLERLKQIKREMREFQTNLADQFVE
jgi:hypothetical protein